jgi:glycosyltransferase involved in cell wall biosynthesis
MKILVLCSQAKGTGAIFRAEYIWKYLKKAGADAEYIRPPLGTMPFMFDFFLSMFYYFFALMNRKPDTVIIIKPYPNTVLPALMLKSAGAKIIIDIDDLDYAYRKSVLSGLINRMQARMIETADLLTSHNDELIRAIKREHPEFKDRIYRLNQCVDLELFSIKSVDRRSVKDIRAEFSGKRMLFYMANLNIASHLDEILSAIAVLKKEEIILVIAGGGPLLSRYKRAARSAGVMEKTVFLGPVDREKAVNYMAASDLCLVYYNEAPVNKYRASMKLREYLALSKNVVADGVGEIKNFRDVIYMSRPTVLAYAAEIKKRLKTLDKRAKKGYKLIRNEYNWGVEAGKFYKFLREMPVFKGK